MLATTAPNRRGRIVGAPRHRPYGGHDAEVLRGEWCAELSPIGDHFVEDQPDAVTAARLPAAACK
jgi:hypothetical protein